jgi:ATPase family associated with various cellular activities (AAA)
MSAPTPIKSKPNSLKTTADTIVSIFEGVERARNTARNYYKQHFEYSIIISETDPLYFEVNKWLIAVLPEEKNRALEIGSNQSFNSGPVADSDSSSYKPKPLVIRYNESISRKVEIDGYSVGVSVIIPEGQPNELGYQRMIPKKIEFVTRSHAAQQAVIAKLEDINQSRATSRKAVLKVVGRWTEWTTRSDLPPRTMQSVSLPEEQKERIIADLKQFLSSEEQYNNLAIPWHRAYMFEGPPGTGKTSLAKALANEFNLDLWYASLADLSAESSLMELLNAVGPRSILLLEDIDTIKITHDRDGADQGKINLGSLLNVLDGVATPHGLITVMTTNYFEKLDGALTRAGRMDMVERIDYASYNTIKAMYTHFYGKQLMLVSGRSVRGRSHDLPIAGLETSAIAEIMKRHMNDAKGAAVAIGKLLEER